MNMNDQSVWLQESRYVTLDPSRITEGFAIRPELTWVGQIGAYPSQFILSILAPYAGHTETHVEVGVLSDEKSEAEVLKEAS